MLKTKFMLILIMSLLLVGCTPAPTAEEIAKALRAQEKAERAVVMMRRSEETCRDYAAKKRDYMNKFCVKWRERAGLPKNADIMPGDDQ